MQREPSNKEKLLHKLSSAIHQYRYVLISVLGALAVLVVTWIVVTEVRSKRIESAAVLVDFGGAFSGVLFFWARRDWDRVRISAAAFARYLL